MKNFVYNRVSIHPSHLRNDATSSFRKIPQRQFCVARHSNMLETTEVLHAPHLHFGDDKTGESFTTEFRNEFLLHTF